MYLGILLGEYQLLSNCSESGRHGYCFIHGANYTFYVTNTYLNWILRFDWLYHYSGSSTSTICYGYQTLTLKAKGWAQPDYRPPACDFRMGETSYQLMQGGDTQALTVGRSATVVVKGQGHQNRAKSTVKISNPQSKSTEISSLSHRSKIEKGS